MLFSSELTLHSYKNVLNCSEIVLLNELQVKATKVNLVGCLTQSHSLSLFIQALSNATTGACVFMVDSMFFCQSTVIDFHRSPVFSSDLTLIIIQFIMSGKRTLAIKSILVLMSMRVVPSGWHLN